MDTRTGEIYTGDQMRAIRRALLKAQDGGSLWKKEGPLYRKMAVQPTPVQMARKPPKVGRNEPCPCGRKDENGKPIKFKKCCLFPQSQREIEVFRNDEWKKVRSLTEVKKGERFRMFESGSPVKDRQGQTEWIAATNGFINGAGVGAIETVTK